MATSSSPTKIIPMENTLNKTHNHSLHSQINMTAATISKLDPYEHLNIAPNSDGSITRYLDTPTIKANPDAAHGDSVVSKDVTLNAEKKTWVRIYRPTRLPSNDNTVARLPILIYFHWGGFILFTASTKESHQECSRYCSEIPAIVVSVDYRLAPEHRLPAQYEDAIDAILWVKQQGLVPNGEQWLKDYGDFSRSYLCGRGSGGNIAFNAALTGLDLDLKPLKICGLVLNQPMFGGTQRTNSELKFAADQLLPLPVLDLMWDLALPEGTDRDHPYCNPIVDGPQRRKISSLARCLVIGFCRGTMIDRMRDFVTTLVTAGVPVQTEFQELGFHNIDIVDERWANSVLNSVNEFVI